MKCSSTDRDFFRQNGYVHLPEHFSAQQVTGLQDQHAELLDRARSILMETIESGVSLQEMAQKRTQDLIVVPERDTPSVVCRFEFLTGFSAETKVCFEEHVTPILDYLHGEPLVLFKDKCNEKNPQGGAFLPHQDYEAYQVFTPCYHATAMIAMDDMTLENGCLYIAKGYRESLQDHQDSITEYEGGRPMLLHETGGLRHGSIPENVSSLFDWQPVFARKGDLVVFDSFVPHYSEANLSDRPRSAYFLTYNLASEGDWYEEYYHQKRNNYDAPHFHVATPTQIATPTQRVEVDRD